MKKEGGYFVLFTFPLGIDGNVHRNFFRILAPVNVGKLEVFLNFFPPKI